VDFYFILSDVSEVFYGNAEFLHGLLAQFSELSETRQVELRKTLPRTKTS